MGIKWGENHFGSLTICAEGGVQLNAPQKREKENAMKKIHSFKITNENKETVQVSVTVDFSQASEEELMSWALSNRIIAGQRVWRKLSVDEIYENVNRQTFDARTIGQSIKSRKDKVEAIAAALGIDAELAESLVDNPDLINKIKN